MERTSSRPVRVLVHDFPWVHLGMGLFGNFTFVLGSVLFFYTGAVETAAIWLFVVGSTGMFVGSVGELLVRLEKRSRDREAAA